MKKSALLTLLLLGLTPYVSGQIEIRQSAAYKITQALQVDGHLNEPDWNRAPEANEYLVQKEMSEDFGQVNTTVKILYDENSIYFGFICYDSEPDYIFSDIEEPDGEIRDDDSVYALLETPNDLENLFFFGSNLKGTLFDGKITKSQRNVDLRWGGQWRAAGIKTAFGWTLEMAIDLQSLDYRPGENIDLGLKLSRIVPRKESLFRSGPLDPAFDLENLGTLEILELIRTFKRAEFQFHFLSDMEKSQSMGYHPGIDFRYALSPQSIGHVSLNPDFTTVEPDEELINLRLYEILLPEKRNFFREPSSGFFQPLQLFYSKRIGEIYGGVNIQGKTGEMEFFGLSTLNTKDSSQNLDMSNTSALRLRQSLGSRLSLGLTASNLHISGQNYGAAGIDTDILLLESFHLEGQFTASYGEYNQDNLAFTIGPRLETKTFLLRLHFLQIGEKFGDNVNLVGYVPDDNRMGIDAEVKKTFSFKQGSFEQISIGTLFRHFKDTQGDPRMWYSHTQAAFRFRNAWQITLKHTQEYRLNENIRGPILIPGGGQGWWATSVWYDIPDFRNGYTTIESGMDKNDGNAFSLSYTMGTNFGFQIKLADFRKQLSLSRRTSMEMRLTNISYEKNSNPLFQTTSIFMLKGLHNFTPSLQGRLFLQYHSKLEKTTMHMTLVYRFKPPFGSVSLGYQKGTAPFGVTPVQDHSVILKIAYGH